MPQQNKNKMMMGVGLIIAAFLCLGSLFFVFGQSSRAHEEKIAALEAELNRLHQESSPATQTTAKKKGPVRLEDLLKTSESIYSQEEKLRREGFLWIDRKSDSFIITLGALNGLEPGSHLSLYDGKKKIDDVTVDIPLDIISYVKVPSGSTNRLKDNYYRVVME